MNSEIFTQNFLKRDAPWLFLSFLVIFAMRMGPLRQVVVDWDESVYFVIARDIAHGGIPYLNYWDHKGPVLYLLFAPVIWIFGDNLVPLRIFTAVCLLVSMYFAYRVALRLGCGKFSLLTPVIYGLFFTLVTFSMSGLSASSELFMLLPTVIAISCFLDFLESKSPRRLFLSGVFSALAMFVKPVILFTVILIPLILLVKKIKSPDCSRDDFFRYIAIYAAGGLVVALAIFIYFFSCNAFGAFYQAFFVFNFKYTQYISQWEALKRFSDFVWATAKVDTILCLGIGALVLLILIWSRLTVRQKESTVFVLVLTASCLIGILTLQNMHPHYFYTMSLPFSLLIPLTLSVFVRVDAFPVRRFFVGMAMIVVFLVGQSVYVLLDRQKLVPRDTERKVAAYLKEHTTKDDLIFVLGGQPILHFMTGLRSPTKYFVWFHYTDRVKRVLPIEKEALQALAQNRPKYILYAEWPYPFIERWPLLRQIITNEYVQETIIGHYWIYRFNEKAG